jgi:hypothetical protein
LDPFKGKSHNLNVICSPSPYLSDYGTGMALNILDVEIVRAIHPIKD